MKKLLLIIIIVSLIASWPFFKKGYFESHDGEWMVIRFTAFHQTLRSGQFPVRFVDRLNNNYGYPVMNFLYPLPFYLAEIPKLLGLDFVDSIKAVFIVSTILSSALMFIALTQKFSPTSSFAGAIIYLFSPYRFVDLYTRGSLGESVAFAIIPLCLLAILKVENNPKKYLAVLTISIALLITAHNVIALLFLPILMLIVLFFNKKNLKLSFLSLLLGIFSAAFFWIPALLDLKYVRLSQIKVSVIADYLVNPENLIFPLMGIGNNLNKTINVPTQIGILNVFIVILLASRQLISKQKDKFVNLLIAIFFLTAALMTVHSKVLWQNIPFMDIIQFPWRMLSVQIFVASILAAYLIESSGKKMLFSTFISIFAIITSFAYIKPSTFTDKGDDFYSTNEDTTTVRDEYMPIWVKEKKPYRAYEKFETDPNIKTIQESIRPSKYEAFFKSEYDSQVVVNTIYFPGWQATIDGQKHKVEYDSKFGLINFSLPKGEHKVIINYSKTPVHLASELISLAAILITGIYTTYLCRKQNSL